jgi:hypothetical protein
MGWREIHCPKCGEIVKIPWLWGLGLEMIFYCRKCRKPLRINYKWGAVLTGTGWALALVSLQFIAFFTSKFTIVVAAGTFFPLGFFYSFLLRRAALRIGCRNRGR